MKILHLSDLHIGKRVNEFSMLEDQRYILNQILHLAVSQEIQAIAIAGDIYDKSMPSAEAVEVLDDFLSAIANHNIPCFIISGNHDSPERIAYGARIMNGRGVHLSRIFNGEIEKVTLTDEHGALNVYLLPFIKPIHVRQIYPEEEIETYEEAIRLVMNQINLDKDQRNMIITHQFFTNGSALPEISDSETISVGGIDNVDISVFEAFDYVALGHIHKPQKVGRETALYAGSPLKYSLSEANHIKEATIINFGKKGDIDIEKIPLAPRRDMRKIKGPLEKLLSPEVYKEGNQEDYIHIILTDEEEIMDAIGKVRTIYPNVMRLDFENKRTGTNSTVNSTEDFESKTPLQLFQEFYELQNNQPMDVEREAIVKKFFENSGGSSK